MRKPGDFLVCLGDLFDTESNSEAVIKQGAYIASACNLVLAGNHDLPGREGKVSSLQLLSACLEGNNPIVLAPSESFTGTVTVFKEAILYTIPHVFTQGQFENALNTMERAARAAPHGPPRILCLHCNYDSPFIHNDASLNLDLRRAEELLKVFEYVLLGHEHAPRVLHDGRLIILGNTHPTSFADISDKAVWEYTSEEGFTKHCIWSTAEGYREVQWWEELDAVPESVQFVDVVGEAAPQHASEIASKVASLWRKNQNLLMVRNGVVFPAIDAPAQTIPLTARDLPSKVADALKGTDLESLWLRYYEEVRHG